jgi:hypothetical protein
LMRSNLCFVASKHFIRERSARPTSNATIIIQIKLQAAAYACRESRH